MDLQTEHPTPLEQKDKLEFKKCIVALIGPPLVGKSTLGTEISKESNFVYLDIDQIRQDLFNHPTEQRLAPDQEAFAMITSYQKIFELARNTLAKGEPVLLAATYSKKIGHEMLRQLAQISGSPLKVFLLVNSNEDEIRSRLKLRAQGKSLSNIRNFQDLKDAQQRYEKIKGVDFAEIDTNNPISNCKNKIFEFLSAYKI